MAALGAGHAPEDVGLALGHPRGDLLVHAPGDDLAPPCLQQALADLTIDIGRAGDHGDFRVPWRSRRGAP